MGRSSPREATLSPPPLSVRLSVTSRRSSATLPLTSSRRCPPLLPPPPLRSPMSSRRPGHHHWKREIQMPRGSLPAILPRNGGLRNPGDHRTCPIYHQDQDHCSTREKILRLDRRIHPCFTLLLPADVDLQAGVR